MTRLLNLLNMLNFSANETREICDLSGVGFCGNRG